MRLDTLTIVGVGLIGGSVGLAAKARGVARRVVGVGRDERTLARAVAVGAIDSFTTNLGDGASAADLVVVCTPVDRVAGDVLTAATAAPSRSVVTDAGSTKGNIVRALNGMMPPKAAPFVGSHPLAGSEKKGAAHARADLFADRIVVVTPTADTDQEAASVVDLFWQSLGARVIRMDPFEHDEALAATSHLPHAAASGLAAATPVGWLGLTAGGFRDTTRIAGADPDLWAAIFEANRDAVLAATDRFADRMAEFRRVLAAGDRAGLVRWLAEGKKVRDALGS
ncbi:MAG TPA: prephenate dehydrogenase/arogenate dehydrogenase family protein [Fimbriiglobus sp.]|jgi:prephenate dehydrogenase|nr:prephenate dehydrogenase/arogenate dehydrogenase family protein [Fimbriiglobus sp.]